MDQEKNSVTSPPEHHTLNEGYDLKKTNSSSSQDKDYMFDKMNVVEEASYDANEPNNEHKEGSSKRSLYQKYRKLILPAMWLIFTGFLIAAYVLQIPKGYNQELLILGLVYLYFTLYVFFVFAPTTIVSKPWNFCVDKVSTFIYTHMSPRMRMIAYGCLVGAVIIATVFSFPEKEESPRVRRLISCFGLFVFIAATFASSKHRKLVPWNTVSTAILIQFLLALFVFRSTAGHDIFSWLATFAEGYLSKAWYGTDFTFGDSVANAGIFAVSVFPAIIFFASTVQILYYIGAIPFLLKHLSAACMKVLNVSGAESVVAIASPFLGQSENALLIEPLIPHLTKSEIHQIMTCGFATISGSTLYGYIAMGVSGQALLTSCIMSIPCSIAISKIRYPESEESKVAHINEISHDKDTTNALHAAGKGAAVGINIVFLILANLIALLALLNAVNALLTWIGNFITIQNLTLQLITGYVFVPVAWLIGADDKDLVAVGTLMANKVWANEFVAYQLLTSTYKDTLSTRSQLVVTYALCGFGNLSSVGMQVGVLNSLAPKRAGEISSLAVSAMICGCISTWLSASIAGMLV
ncbi:Na+ dependent nucleoside transporter C-terminus-domain-containing protein [Gilbertella persicaria]|uniref:Na+ dependent nucleoside transporter C-terminus-domain-containing protein n=1 Tax=Gilbertella persicaria TaxID=101096 RepID=UPI002220C3BF|nr:Na+ dependent nucleoside transporter C-terminus-domain-containing protein [Gilbertella persicaria]KAI8077964.1 Na+ dependent nucleoside transporter C-terminus-domain-containing protein [Gilbertella persicaria]